MKILVWFLQLVFSFAPSSLRNCYILKILLCFCFLAISLLYFLFYSNYVLLGSKPLELYGTYTWKINKFSEIRNPEIRSNVFEAGGHNW